MLKLIRDGRVVNLFKAIKGSMKPGHKYCKREPLGDGSGFKYYYAGPSGKCGGRDERSEELTHRQAMKRHPEHYDPNHPRFNVSKDTEVILNNSSYVVSKEKLFGNRNFSELVSGLKKAYSGLQSSRAEGFLNEVMHSFSKEIGEGKIYNVDDLIRLANFTIKKFASQSDEYAKERTMQSLELLANIKALNELPQDTVGGAARLERLWENSNQFWNENKAQIYKTYGAGFNFDNIRIRNSGKNVGADRKADLFTEVLNEKTKKWEQDQFALSLKINTGYPISWQEGTPLTAIINVMKNSGIDGMKRVAIQLDSYWNQLNKKFNSKNYPNMSSDNLSREVQYRFKNEFRKKFGLDKGNKRTAAEKDLLADLAHMAMKHTSDMHKDPRTPNLAISMMLIDPKTGVSDYIGASANEIHKQWEKEFAKGPVGVLWERKSGTFKSITGQKIPQTGDIRFFCGAHGKQFIFAILEGRNSKKSFQWRGPIKEHAEIMRRAGRVDSGYGYIVERIQRARDMMKRRMTKSMTPVILLEKATLERKKMNAKYIRKELTESGGVRYIYKETQPRRKKQEDVLTEGRDNFLSTVDSSSPEFKTMFEDAISEIDDQHFIGINAGSTSVRISDDVETFLDALGVPPQLKTKEEFTAASGSFNVSKGKMGFCTANFPDGVPEIVKKVVMMHEVGHAYFYGTLRIKHKKPLSQIDSKDKDQKKFFKDAIKFVDSFGKLDDEIRKKAEEEVADVKGKEKEMIFLDTIKTYMVSEYAALSPEEHFAEVFSRYFIMPEQLQKKEKEVYDHFERFFQKYGR